MRHLILGSSAAAIAAARVLRQALPNDEIIMASADERIYSRCMLHRYLAGERIFGSLDFTEPDFFDQNAIQWLPNNPALSLDCRAQTVHCKNGAIAYDKLLIATGTVSLVPDIPGLRSAENVYTLGSLKDAVLIKRRAKNARNIIILGSGLVGMDAAYGLAGSGAVVRIIEIAGHIIPMQLDSDVASMYQAQFEKAGVQFHLCKRAVAVELDENSNATALELDDGVILPCDMIIVAVGVRANTDYLKNSPIKLEKKLENGVIVDKHMLTSVSDIYAAGDVTGISGSWYAAVKQGRVAAHNMASPENSSYEDKFQTNHKTNTINFSGMTTLSIGKVNPPFDGYEVLQYREVNKYFKLIMKNGIAEGVLLYGDISNSGYWKYIIKNAVPLNKLKKSPVLADFADFYDIDQHTAEFRYKL